jgi:hypothetical protein
VIFVNGEKIIYWRNYALEGKTAWTANAVIGTNSLITYSGNLYLTLGNVYGSYFANITSNVQQVNVNTLAQIRRGADATSTPLVQISGSKVVDSSVQQIVPNTTVYSSYVATTTVYQSADPVTVSIGLNLSANITVNGGDILQQINGNGNVISTMTVLQSVTNSKQVAVYVTGGAVLGLPDEYDNPLGFDYNGDDVSHLTGLGFDNTVGNIYVNGNNSGVLVQTAYQLGVIGSGGTVTVNSGNHVQQSNLWYTPGPGYPSNGLGLTNSTTVQATFLKSSVGFTPPTNTTP